MGSPQPLTTFDPYTDAFPVPAGNCITLGRLDLEFVVIAIVLNTPSGDGGTLEVKFSRTIN